MNSNSSAAPKKPYQKPGLRVYGNIDTMTGNLGAMTVDDGATMGNNKTA